MQEDDHDDVVPFKGDFFGAAEEYASGDLPFDEDRDDRFDDQARQQDEVDELSDDKLSDDDAVGRDILQPSPEVQRDGHKLPPPPIPSIPGSPAQHGADLEQGAIDIPADASAEPPARPPPPSNAPGGVHPDSHEQICRPPAYIVAFGGKAGAPVPAEPAAGRSSQSRYTSYAVFVI
ncbi:uncharacterized protein C8Q71DRAFT_727132 [Rhodofomes roseus]|uniref:Uncharacterized protein n=1 Tax=Rhodofomes roseus TaxID=34475 RepID=A0ABQ8K3J9_9APHY|nr:uncharacterized protein C8Q71DRAFT_727132 [Rhodofomes roseus]KAH9830939.1 hypothetical protein C8Q71DRAFT_727132 [Rhodofomes roseus]